MTKVIDNTNLGHLISKMKAAFWPKSKIVVKGIDSTPTENSTNLIESGGVYDAVSAKYTKPSTGIPASDIESGVIPTVPTDVVKYTSQSLTTAQQTQTRTNIGAGTYSKPSGGIPSTDMASAVQTSLGKADTAYQKPSGGIPKTDMANGVQESLELADSAVQAEPIGSIIPPVDPSEFATKEEVDELDQEIYGAGVETDIPIPITGQTYSNKAYTISAQNKWAANQTYHCAVIPVVPGKTYKFVIGSVPGVFAFLRDNSIQVNATPAFSTQYQGRILGENMPSQVVIPSDCNYIYAVETTSGGTVDTQIFRVDTVMASGLKNEVAANTAKLTIIDALVNGREEIVTMVDMSEVSTINYYINPNTKWDMATPFVSKLVPVSPGQRYLLDKGANPGVIAILTSDSYSTGATPAFSSEYPGRIVAADIPDSIVIPSDGRYLYTLRVSTTGDCTLQPYLVEVEGIVGLVEDVAANKESISDMQPRLGEVENEIDTIKSVIYHPMDLSRFNAHAYVLLDNGNFQVSPSGSPQACLMVPITPGYPYRLKANSAGAIIAVLTSTLYPGNNNPASFATGYTSRLMLGDSEEYSFVAPSDGHCLYLLKIDSSGTDRLPIYVKTPEIIIEPSDKEGTASLRQVFDNIQLALDANGWELPTTPGMVNALKKAAQATEIVYDAKANYPNNSSSTGGSAGEHTGMPYSSTKAIRKNICWEVSQRTFMTAVNNPYSLFYTEDISAAHTMSGYGFTYNGVNCGTYYGMVCSTFALWALGFSIPWDTEQFDYLGRSGELLEISEQSAQGVHICDIIWMQGHTALVTGVQRDQYGNVIKVHTSESYPNNMIITTRTASQFDAYLAGRNCILYRPVKLYSNTAYSPSEFVAVRGESTPPAYQYNDDICFFAGDYAAWRDGDDCWLNYTKGDYTSVKIYKDNALVATLTLDADSSVHKLDVTSYMDGYGSYKACLTDGVNDSDFTYWKLIDALTTYQDNEGYQTIGWSSNNGTPLWLQVCSATGVSYCWHEITAEDIANGHVDLDLNVMIADQYDDATPVATTYVRVLFGTDYGCVVSPMVQM